MTKEEAAAVIIRLGHPTASDPAYAQRRVLEAPEVARRIYHAAVDRCGPGDLSQLKEAAAAMGIAAVSESGPEVKR
jgi:hypothetical protein